MTNETIDTAALAEEIATEIEVDLLGRPGKGVMLCLSGAQARALAALLRGVVDGPKVKPLEWERSVIASWNDDWHTVPTGYQIRCADENGWKWSGQGAFGYERSPGAAKFAAQADYERRIRSALVLPSPPLSTTKEG